jgi:pyruvate ferredoxin oxidoreductase delta subunit
MRINRIANPAVLPTVEEIPLGGILGDGGNSVDYLTGMWRAQRPVFYRGRCTDCLLCWVACPDAAIALVSSEVQGVDKEHCKGCGICARVCPLEPKAIEMHEGGVYG